jgi:transcriptional regulator with XRE-family HTH domain
MSTFAEALRALIDERGMSQAQLARSVGVSAQAVSAWTTGSVTPARENVERIEDELAVDARGSLVALAGYSTNGLAEVTVESAIRADPGLDPEDKRVLLRILRLARERHPEAG